MRIGIVGPDDLVERVLMLPSASNGRSLTPRLVPMPYKDESQTLDALVATAREVDAYLFTGPVPYDLAVAASALVAPATFIPLSGAALYATLVRGVTAGDFAPDRLSIDTLVSQDIEEAYSELGLPTGKIQMYGHAPGHHLEDIVAFHFEALTERGATAALTGLRSAHEEMLRLGLRSYRMVPTLQSIRSALRTAVLMATGARLGDAQVAIAVVAVGPLDALSEFNALDDRRAESLLAAQRTLLAEARQIGAVVVPVGPGLFLVIGTVKAFEVATDGYRHCPFYASLEEGIDHSIAVGLGMADSALLAQRAAWQALRACHETGGGHGRLAQPDGSVMVLPGLRGDRTISDRPPVGRLERRYLVDLAQAYTGTGIGGSHSVDPIVSAVEVADRLDLSPRTARRLLISLSEADLAWPLPPERGPHPGRPRHRWRLLLGNFPPDTGG